jgi:hypothetical protein
VKLNQAINLRVEDFQSEQSWIGRLFTQLNPFIAAVNRVLDNNIDYHSNIKSIVKEIRMTKFQSFSLLWPYQDSNPLDVRIIKAMKGNQNEACILLNAWKYDAAKREIQITNIFEVTESGIDSLNGSYTFTIRATV